MTNPNSGFGGSSMTSTAFTSPRRRWHELYRAIPQAIAPRSETALEMFRAMVVAQRGRPLVHYFDQSITADDIDAMSDAFAVALQERGVQRGDRIAMYLQNVPQVPLTVLAAWKCGAVIVP